MKKKKMLTDSVPKPAFRFTDSFFDWLFLLCPQMAEGAKELSESFFYKDTDPIHKSSTIRT